MHAPTKSFTAKDRFQLLNCFMGYGNGKQSKLFFFGLEEGIAFGTSDQIDRWLQAKNNRSTIAPWIAHWYNPRKIEQEVEVFHKSMTVRREVELCLALLHKDPISVREYIAAGLVANNSTPIQNRGMGWDRAVHSNVYPIGAVKESFFHSDYGKAFKVRSKAELWKVFRSGYNGKEHMLNLTRAKVIGDFLIGAFKRKMKPFVFIFGKVASSFFIDEAILKGLDYDVSQFIRADGCGTHLFRAPISCSPDRHIWICGHPSGNYLSAAGVKYMIDEIKRLHGLPIL